MYVLSVVTLSPIPLLALAMWQNTFNISTMIHTSNTRMFLPFCLSSLITFLMHAINILETASCRNAGKGCVPYKRRENSLFEPSGQTLPLTLHKQELRALGLHPFMHAINIILFCEYYQYN